MSSYKVAHRYAKSLLELSEKHGLTEVVHKDIESFLELCNNTRELTLLLKNPIVKHDKKRIILNKIFEKHLNSLTTDFFNIVCRKNRANILIEVAKDFHIQYNEHKGIESAKVTTASPLDDVLRKEFEKLLKEISGKKLVEIQEVVDPDLIGGFILKIGDRQLDDSVSGKLNTLRKKLIVNV